MGRQGWCKWGCAVKGCCCVVSRQQGTSCLCRPHRAPQLIVQTTRAAAGSELCMRMLLHPMPYAQTAALVAARCDARSALAAEGYAAFLAGSALLERGNAWKAALAAFERAK